MPFSIYVAAAIVMVASHGVLSAPSVRPVLRQRLGTAGFYTVYSLISFTALGVFLWAYVEVGVGAWLYEPLPGAKYIAITVMPVALFLIIGRLTTPYGTPEAPHKPQGFYRLCRYPGSVGLALWAVLHLLNTGDARRGVLFCAMLLICVLAMIKNNRLRRHAKRPHLANTSVFPFAAIVGGRQRVDWREIGWRPALLAAAAYAALLVGHPIVIGVDPLAF